MINSIKLIKQKFLGASKNIEVYTFPGLFWGSRLPGGPFGFSRWSRVLGSELETLALLVWCLNLLPGTTPTQLNSASTQSKAEVSFFLRQIQRPTRPPSQPPVQNSSE